MEMIAAYTDITSLNSSILNELIHSIEIEPIQKVDGVKRRNIRIRYRHYCYIEMFTGADLFEGWTEEDWNDWREIDVGFDKKFADRKSTRLNSSH